MQEQSLVNDLITKAGLICGSEYKLAKALGVPQQHLSEWKAGRRTCTPADQARLAGFAREDAVQALVRATIEGAKGLKREQLQAVLGKWSRQTGGAISTVLLSLASLSYGMEIFDIPRCIFSRVMQRRYTFC